ncbi:monovalent cation:proton antiporter family protein [Mesobacillus foraminis]|uniref:CPA2 family monovalent cation:H+ antiporter-2 n=1 Tax=Mesobacillus foraminis TaxID=279826 RepID=A0A4R2BKT4_9BACI|nr:monovalent cation:proton antiporter family protein [Mesobacillus foraminis]TCN27847.1 CPA2 family monovalent cation:H+ antiporter-2 [Mesobacillus foraminis]
MEQHGSIMSLLIVIIVAFLTPILLHRFKLRFVPVVVAEIIMGLIIGKSGLDLVHEDAWLEILSTLGFLFLMFLSGLEIDFSAFSMKNQKGKKLPNGKAEPNTFMISTIIFAGIFIASLGLSYLFVLAGFIDNAFLMTLIISTISLGVVVPTLKEAHLMKTNIGQIILLIAVIADLVTMILLAVFVSLYDKEGGNTWLLLILFAAGVGLYFIAKRFQGRNFVSVLASGTTQIGTRAVFTLLIVLVAISETVGAENILGAFLAGVLVSLLSPDQEMIHKLDSFGYGFVIPIFFVMIGVELDLWSLLSEKKMLLLIPLLLIALLLSKLIPIFLLKKWYDKNTVIASGFLLTSTLSLVIAAATIGERMGVITPEMSGTLILVAVISCVLTPIVFKKMFPRSAAEDKKLKVALIGANQMTLPVTRELNSSHYEPVLYHTKQDKADKQIASSVFDIVEVEDYSIVSLEEVAIFTADIIVISTGDENTNADIAMAAKEKGAERVIARIENPELEPPLREQGIEVFSVLMSTTTLLRALIESPGIINILTNQESSLHEIRMLNDHFDGMTLRRFPFTGDVIFVRILRGKDSIVPHGDTELRLHDRLIVTGSNEYVDELRTELESGRWY